MNTRTRSPLDPWLAQEVARFDPRVPLEAAWLPPSSWYNNARFFELERDTVFRNNWLIAARSHQFAKAGDFVAGAIAGEPYVVVRGEDGVLRAFYNVCRHHAAQVAVGEGCAEALVCPYHGWTYALDGALKRAPELGAVKDFDRDKFGLVPMHVTEWCGLVFVSMATDPRPLAAEMGELERRLREMHLDELQFVARRKYTLACNWKVYVDNYLDGGYHVSYLHKGLAGQLDLDSYRTEIFGRYSIQSGAGASGGGSGASGSDFSERIGDRVLYAWLYPNLMINRYGPMMDTNWVIPRGHDETLVIFDYYFTRETAADAAFVEKSLAASDVVQAEDVGICESVQQGLLSSSYDKGRYSAKLEQGEYHFHRLLAADFRAASDGADGVKSPATT
ncbi:MAG TPA: aromatic ring-hydroxylating dioxygenase subunit alpha [Candidatus Krumholzibacteria bacterium]|nr:aromatic ring-hydroxylating dioxygenase subunit alpha [Candidatus Krumholzibacteria bacterium]